MVYISSPSLSPPYTAVRQAQEWLLATEKTQSPKKTINVSWAKPSFSFKLNTDGSVNDLGVGACDGLIKDQEG